MNLVIRAGKSSISSMQFAISLSWGCAMISLVSSIVGIVALVDRQLEGRHVVRDIHIKHKVILLAFMELIPCCNCIFTWSSYYCSDLLPFTPADIKQCKKLIRSKWLHTTATIHLTTATELGNMSGFLLLANQSLDFTYTILVFACIGPGCQRSCSNKRHISPLQVLQPTSSHVAIHMLRCIQSCKCCAPGGVPAVCHPSTPFLDNLNFPVFLARL